jgi:hypothetical protein
VQIVTCSLGALGPFTSGISTPRIWLPASLQGEQSAAVLEHELAHVRDLDVLWFGFTGVMDGPVLVRARSALSRALLARAGRRRQQTRRPSLAVFPRQVLAQSILSQAAAPLTGAPAARMSGNAARLRRRLLALAGSVPRAGESKTRLAFFGSCSRFRSCCRSSAACSSATPDLYSPTWRGHMTQAHP